MKNILVYFIFAAITLLTPLAALAEEPTYPDYIQKAQSLVEKASSRASDLNSFTDEVLIARNFIRNAEAEYKKNVSWTGKLDAKVEATIRYYSAVAELQASVVLSRVGKITQEKERARLESQTADVKARIKVFDDKNAEIAKLSKSLAACTNENAGLSTASAVGASAEQKVIALTGQIEILKQSLAAAEGKSAELDKARTEIAALKANIATLTAQKGASESQSKEQIDALNRQKDFSDDVGKLGGVIKPGSDNMTVIFVRSGMIKAPKNDKLTPEGEKAIERVAEMLKKFPEFRIKLKVHGFGAPAKTEDAAATDRMARLIREVLLEKGKFEPATVEALGAGSAEPIYPKTNVEGNRRVEITFVKR